MRHTTFTAYTYSLTCLQTHINAPLFFFGWRRRGMVEALDAHEHALQRGDIRRDKVWRVHVYQGMDVVHGVWLDDSNTCLFALLCHPSSPCSSSPTASTNDATPQQGSSSVAACGGARPHKGRGNRPISSLKHAPGAGQGKFTGSWNLGGVSGHGLDWQKLLEALRHWDLRLHTL